MVDYGAGRRASGHGDVLLRNGCWNAGLGRYAGAAGSIVLPRTRRRAGRRARGQVVKAGSCRGTWVAGAWSLGRECIGTSRWEYATTECGQLVEEPGCWSVVWDEVAGQLTRRYAIRQSMEQDDEWPSGKRSMNAAPANAQGPPSL